MKRVVFDFGRVIEGLCPDTEHGVLERLDDGFGFCPECECEVKIEGSSCVVRNKDAEVNMRGLSLAFVGSDDSRSSEQP